MPWVSPLVGVGANLLLGGGQSGGGASGGGAQYVGTNIAGADTGWQSGYNAQNQIAQGNQASTSPYFGQSLTQGENINYQPYLNASNQAGNAYQQAGNLAQGQVAGYGQEAQGALGQQQQMYGAGQQIYNQAFSPLAGYGQAAQNTSDQINAGQAMRGLGNSPEGAMEYDQGMGNFNINWQNQQTNQEAQGINAMAQANSAGIGQGTQYGAMQTAGLGAQNAAGTAYGMAGSVPMQAQQYAASQPGAIANTYQGYLQSQQGMYQTPMNQALAYMNNGQSAQQGNSQQTAANNAAMTSALGTAAGSYFGQNSGFSNPYASASALGNANVQTGFNYPDMSGEYYM